MIIGGNESNVFSLIVKHISEVILEHARLQALVLGEIADLVHSPVGENRAVVRPLSPALVFDSAADFGELQVLRLKISGGLEKARQLLLPAVDEKRAVDFSSGVSL